MISRFRLRLAIGVLALAGVAGVYAQLPKPAAPAFQTRLLLLDAVSTGQRIVAAGERGFILLSDDGQHWRAAQTVGTATLTALTRRGAQLWAAGHDTSILKSTDSGASWRRVHYAIGAFVIEMRCPAKQHSRFAEPRHHREFVDGGHDKTWHFLIDLFIHEKHG